MKIIKKVAATGAAGVLGLTGLGLVAGGVPPALADTVATTLDESDALRHGPGGFGGHGGLGPVDLDAAASAVGLTTEELRAALAEDATTLADVAQAQADELTAALPDRVAEAVDSELRGDPGHGHHGGFRGGFPDVDSTEGSTDGSTATPGSSST